MVHARLKEATHSDLQDKKVESFGKNVTNVEAKLFVYELYEYLP